MRAADVDALDVMDLLGSLVDKSLVVADRGRDRVRYRLLETIRQYSAQELVRAAGETEAMRVSDRHAEYYLNLAVAAAPALTGPQQGRYLRQLDSEWDNVRAAFAHLRADERSEDVLRLGVSVARFVLSRGHTEVIRYLAEAAASDAEFGRRRPVELGRIRSCRSLTMLLLRKDPAELPGARRHAERALELARTSGNAAVEARALGALVRGSPSSPATKSKCGGWPRSPSRSPGQTGDDASWWVSC